MQICFNQIEISYNIDVNGTKIDERINELESKVLETRDLIKLTKMRIYEMENHFTSEILEVYLI